MQHNLPSVAGRMAERFPNIWAAYAQLGETAAKAGPLDAKTRRLIKLGACNWLLFRRSRALARSSSSQRWNLT
jgi:hypothetical protein